MDRKWFLKLLGLGSIGSVVGGYSSHYQQGKKAIKPRKLKRGDTIGLISPGMRLPNPQKYDEIIAQVKELGYKVKVGDNARNQYGYLAGTDKERAADLNTMFADDSVDAILPFRGGWGCNRILHLIDYKTIQENPKILVGFSDITTLLLAIYAKTGLVTFHGPVGKSDWTEYTTRYFGNAVSNQKLNKLQIPDNRICEDCNSLSVITPGKATGKLLGGNLSVLTAMMGSDYLPKWQNSILFLEDVGEDVYRIDRMLTQLKLAGILKKVSGVVFGQCTSCDQSSDGLSLQQVFEDHIKPLKIPSFSGAMFGHVKNMLTLPVGIQATMHADSGAILLEESATI
jgi:muramoyltetrapeptide carboxypeptidase